MRRNGPTGEADGGADKGAGQASETRSLRKKRVSAEKRVSAAAIVAVVVALGAADPREVILEVEAGEHDREGTPIVWPLPRELRVLTV